MKLNQLLLIIELVSCTSDTPQQSCCVLSFLNRTGKHLSTQSTVIIWKLELLSDTIFLEDLIVLEVLLPHSPKRMQKRSAANNVFFPLKISHKHTVIQKSAWVPSFPTYHCSNTASQNTASPIPVQACEPSLGGIHKLTKTKKNHTHHTTHTSWHTEKTHRVCRCTESSRAWREVTVPMSRLTTLAYHLKSS